MVWKNGDETDVGDNDLREMEPGRSYQGLDASDIEDRTGAGRGRGDGNGDYQGTRRAGWNVMMEPRLQLWQLQMVKNRGTEASSESRIERVFVGDGGV